MHHGRYDKEKTTKVTGGNMAMTNRGIAKDIDDSAQLEVEEGLVGLAEDNSEMHERLVEPVLTEVTPTVGFGKLPQACCFSTEPRLHLFLSAVSCCPYIEGMGWTHLKAKL